VRLTSDECRERFLLCREAHLGTVTPEGAPHLVPVAFAVAADRVVFAIDRKPKATTEPQRLKNIRYHPRVTLLVDHYGEDWSRLWWVRADAHAEIMESGAVGWRAAVDALQARYEQYRLEPPDGPVVSCTVDRWSGWRAA
jgi:PPOX class probable F420-dependent enzyme